jgi:hypothetical protein
VKALRQEQPAHRNFYAGGSERTAYGQECLDWDGNTVDIHWYCSNHAPIGTGQQLHERYGLTPADWFTAYSWPESCICCQLCGETLNVAANCDCGGHGE